MLPQTDALPAFAHGIDPVLFCEDRLRFHDGRPFIPDPWQAKLLRSDAVQIILNIGRQSGKLTVVAALAVWTALYHPGALIVLILPSLRQSSELMLKCREFMHSLGSSVTIPEDNKLSAILANHSRIVALPGDNPRTIRGFSALTLVVEDAAAFVRDETHVAILPMLAASANAGGERQCWRRAPMLAASANGRLILMSTPWLCLGHFHAIWRTGLVGNGTKFRRRSARGCGRNGWPSASTRIR
jgi:hypothetical protein